MTDKYYKVRITPKLESYLVLRVPKGVQINEEILEESPFFEDWYSESPPFCGGLNVHLELEELDEKSIKNIDYLTLDNEGEIT